MKFFSQGKYFRYLPEDDGPSIDLMLGVRQKKGDPWYTIENNVVNRIVLGLSPVPRRPESPIAQDESLMDYQVKDIYKMMSLEHCLNANPMGLGKTVEAIVMLRESHAHNALIITPKIIRSQWASQILKWWSPEKKVVILDKPDKQIVEDDGTIYIINYDKLKSEKVLNKLRRFQWDFLVIDEAHKIKTRTSQRTKAVKAIPARRRIALTGTPILSYVNDLWSILHFLDVQYSGNSYWNFIKYFCKLEETQWGNKIVGMTDDPSKIAILNTLLDSVSIRNNSVEVAQGKLKEIVTLPMTAKQLDMYKKFRDLVLDELPENGAVANGAVLTMRLRQTTTWPGLFVEGEAGSKFEWILEACQNNLDEKFVVFSCFEKAATALVEFLKANKVHGVTITGQNHAITNAEHKKEFIENKKCRVLVGTIGAMGQGYDGLQEVSRLMIMMDREWSPEIMEQAEDRLHRMGQDYPVTIYYLECEKSFDQYVGKINRTKADDIRLALAEVE